MAQLATYNPEEVTVLFAGTAQISGFADGAFISISKDTPSFSTKETSDGIVGRTYNNSGLYTVELTLASTSESNQLLTYALRADELTRMGKFPLIIKDQLGGSLFFSSTSWIETIPDTDYSTEIGERTWSIKCSQASLNLGGNESDTSGTEDFLNGALGLLSGIL